MLSISIIKSSAQAVSYYEKDDYYLNGSRSSPQAKQAELQDDGTSHSEGDLGVGATSSTGAGRGSGGNGTTGSEQSHALDDSNGPSSQGHAAEESGSDGPPASSESKEQGAPLHDRATADPLGSVANDSQEEDGNDPTSGEGVWFGRGAQALGLKGVVNRQQFKDVLDGHFPNGTVLGTTREGKFIHTPGWDFTFSAPKSVSILVEIGRDERVLKAHNAAVHDALAWLEKHALGVRKRAGEGERVFEETQSMVAALFVHHTSRNLDPQTHTHAVVANATEDPDGKWRSVFSKVLFDHKMAAGNVYRAALAQQLLKLGYHVEQTEKDGRFEVTEVSKELLRTYSKRREEIVQKLEQWGSQDARTAARATLVTRPSSQTVNREILEQIWDGQLGGADINSIVQQARDRGDVTSLDSTQTVESLLHAGERRSTPRNWINQVLAFFKTERTVNSAAPVKEDMMRAVSDAVRSLSDAEAVFSHADLVRWTLAGAMERGGNREEVERAIGEFALSGRLHALDQHGVKAWTTPKAMTQERKIIEAVNHGKGAVPAIMSAEKAREALTNVELEGGRRLSKEQVRAAQLILTTEDRFVGIVGRPGTGKTTLMQAVKRAVIEAVQSHAHERGYTLIGMAQNADAASKLGEEAKIQHSTIHKHLNVVNVDLASLKQGDRSVLEKYQNQIWIVDESSQLPNGLARRLTFAAERLGARVVFVGDPKQLAAIEAGKPFELMLTRGEMASAELKDIKRQRHPEHRQAVLDALEGKWASVIQRLEKNIVEIKDDRERLNAMLKVWGDLPPEQRPNAMLQTLRNQDRRYLNEGVLNRLREEGAFDAEQKVTRLVKSFTRSGDLAWAGTYKKGDRLHFGRTLRSVGAESGEYRRVLDIDVKSRQLTIEGPAGKPPVTFDVRKMARTWTKKTVTIWREEETTIAPGQKIRWTLNQEKELGLRNGMRLVVEAVHANEITVRRPDGKLVHLPQGGDPKMQHWVHGYATTTFASQGQSPPLNFANVPSTERGLLSQTSFLVAISRHVDNVTLFVDDKAAVLRQVRSHAGAKPSALETMEASRLAKRMNTLDNAVNSGGAPVVEHERNHGMGI